MKILVNWLEILILCQLNILLCLIPAYAKDHKGEGADQVNSTVVLRPKIRITAPQEQPKLSLEYLMPYLENMIFINDPMFDLKHNKIKAKRSRSRSKYNNKPAVSELGVVQPIQLADLKKHGSYIVGFAETGIQSAGTNDHVLAVGIANDLYYMYSLAKPVASYYHPVTKEYLGTQMRIVGKAKVIKRNKLSLLQIIAAKELITEGILVFPSKSLNLTNDLEPIPPKQDLTGYILSIMPALCSSGLNQVIIISLGARDGLQIGNVLKIKANNLQFKDPYDHPISYEVMDDTPKGEVLVYDVADKLSLGIIIKSSGIINFLDQLVAN